MAPLSGRIVGSRGSRLPLISGNIALIAGALILTQLTATTQYSTLLVSYAIYGIGCGLINPPITHTAVSGMPPSQAGVAAAIASTSRQVGGTLGVAVLGSLAAGAVAGPIGPSFAAATHASWWVVVGLGVAGLSLGVLTTTDWAKRTARRTAKRLREDHHPGAPDAVARDEQPELVTG
jgi:MFS family permease